ncbi:bacteriocin immunity protein [Pantoea sp. KXB45]|uniref:bacteriocin immunity protein n=1 Tax=Pantoea sp. KXB45 TaxID=3402309 RepID=UPI003AB79FCA
MLLVFGLFFLAFDINDLFINKRVNVHPVVLSITTQASDRSTPNEAEVEMKLKFKLQEYTEAEFTRLVSEICSAKGGEAYQNTLLENFISVSEHPDGSDLIFYCEDEDATPDKIVSAVKVWRKANNKKGFKS